MNEREMLKAAYSDFNARRIDAVLARMCPDVMWANGMEGGDVHGVDSVREYWLRQFAMLSPHVEPIDITQQPDGRFAVQVHQTVHDLDGKLLLDTEVRHFYTIKNGLIARMDINSWPPRITRASALLTLPVYTRPLGVLPYTLFPESKNRTAIQERPPQGKEPEEMPASIPATPPIAPSDLDFDNGVFDSAAFAAHTLASCQSLAAVIDHTALKPDTTRAQIEQLCQEAAGYRFACVMVNPVWAATAVRALSGSGIPVGVVIGFPFGASLVSTLRQEAAALIRLGARELDMVLPVGVLKSGNYSGVQHTIHAAVTVAHHNGALLKVTLETALLSMEEKLRATEIAIQAGADFIKTSSGFSTGGASVADVALLRGVAGARCGVKASGGIRSLTEAKAMLEAGANRLGTSAGVAIVQELGAE